MGGRDRAYSVGTGNGHDLGPELYGLGSSSPRHVAEAGDGHFLALDALAGLCEKMAGEIQGAEAGSLRTEDGAAPGAALSGEDAGIVFARKLFVHSVEESYFTSSHSDISGRDILVGTDAVPKLEHERLAEAHDLGVRLAHRIEIGTALGAAHGKGGKSVLESLFETEELEHGRRHGLVETQAALVRSYGAVELDAVAGVDLHLALVIDPRHPERKDAVRLDDALDDFGGFEFGMLVVDILNGLQYLLHGLKVLFLSRILCLEPCHYFSCFHFGIGYY